MWRRSRPEMKAALSADGRYLDVTLTGRSDLTQVWFPTWSEKNGQDDLQWYEAKKQADGSWTYSVALSRHNTTGTFIHAYGNDKKNLVAHTTAYVEKIPGPEMKAALSADGRYLDVTLTGRGDLTQVWFPTWSQVNGQDDLRWHEAARQADGSWTCRIALSDHSGTGVYFIHAYGNNKKNLVAHTTVTVPQASQPSQPPQPVRSGMQAALSADGRYLDVTLAGRSDLTKVWFPTWSAVNGQDDLRWYEATKQPDGSWTCRVPLANHKSAGGFFLHAYGNNKKNLVAHTTASVSQVVSPQVWTRSPRRRPLYDRDPDGPQRSDEGLVPHLGRSQRPGRPAVVPGGQAVQRRLVLYREPVPAPGQGHLLHPCLRQYQTEPGGPHHRHRELKGGTAPRREHPDQVLEIKL
ncbi:MAG: GBS Bsp-like repeat-containing protein [Oscillospiraceae bacterium]